MQAGLSRLEEWLPALANAARIVATAPLSPAAPTPQRRPLLSAPTSSALSAVAAAACDLALRATACTAASGALPPPRHGQSA